MAFINRINLFSLAGSNYDLSRLVGLTIICINIVMLPFINFRKIPKAVLILVGMFSLHLFMEIFIGGDINRSLGIFVRTFSSLVILIVFLGNVTEHGEVVERFLIGIAIYSAVFVIIQVILHRINPSVADAVFGARAFVSSFSTFRAQGPLVSAGGSASAMAIGVVMLVRRSIAKRFQKWDIVILVVLTLGLFMNFTRTYVFMVVLFVGTVLLYYRRIGLLTKIAAVISVSVIIVGTSVGWSHITDRFRDLPVTGDIKVAENQMFQGRVLLSQLIWDDFKKSDATEILLGKGLYNSNRVLERYFGAAASTHNDLLWLVSNCGLVGLILYLGFIFSLLFGRKGDLSFHYRAFVTLFVFFSGLGGETIAITGHRYLQMICVGLLAGAKCDGWEASGSIQAAPLYKETSC
jgi:hypothetical protein